MERTRIYVIHPERPVTFGKWKGKSWKEVFMFDNGYFNWVIENVENIIVFTSLFEQTCYIDIQMFQKIETDWSLTLDIGGEQITVSGQYPRELLGPDYTTISWRLDNFIEQCVNSISSFAKEVSVSHDTITKLKFIFDIKSQLLTKTYSVNDDADLAQILKLFNPIKILSKQYVFKTEFKVEQEKRMKLREEKQSIRVKHDKDEDNWHNVRYNENDLLYDAFEGDWENAWNID